MRKQVAAVRTFFTKHFPELTSAVPAAELDQASVRSPLPCAQHAVIDSTPAGDDPVLHARRLQGAHAALQRVPQRTRRAGATTHAPIARVISLFHLLTSQIGDAAHATLPTTGQGLTASLLDAEVRSVAGGRVTRSAQHLLGESGLWDGRTETAPAAFREFTRTQVHRSRTCAAKAQVTALTRSARIGAPCLKPAPGLHATAGTSSALAFAWRCYLCHQTPAQVHRVHGIRAARELAEPTTALAGVPAAVRGV
jgi:hypothetical protein